MRLTIKTPADVAAVVPLVLGFHPEDSIVLLCFGGRSAQSGPHVRVAHPHTPEDLLEVARVLGEVAAQHGGPETTWMAVSYTEDQNEARDALLTIAAILTGPTGKVGALLQVTGAVEDGASRTVGGTAGEGQQWIAHDDLLDPETDPQGARDLRAAGIITGPHGLITQADRDRVDAQAVAHGVPIATGTREDIGLHLTPSPSEAAQQQVIRDVIAGVRGQRLAQRLDPTSVEAHAFHTDEAAWLTEQIERFRSTQQRLSDADLARLLVDLADPLLRDIVTVGLTRADARVDHDLWADAARRAPVEHAERPLIYAGLTAWLTGNGALAWIAHDLAQEQAATTGQPGQPEESGLAGILRELLQRALPPHAWDDVAHTMRAEVEHTGQPGQPGSD